MSGFCGGPRSMEPCRVARLAANSNLNSNLAATAHLVLDNQSIKSTALMQNWELVSTSLSCNLSECNLTLNSSDSLSWSSSFGCRMRFFFFFLRNTVDVLSVLWRTALNSDLKLSYTSAPMVVEVWATSMFGCYSSGIALCLPFCLYTTEADVAPRYFPELADTSTRTLSRWNRCGSVAANCFASGHTHAGVVLWRWVWSIIMSGSCTPCCGQL